MDLPYLLLWYLLGGVAIAGVGRAEPNSPVFRGRLDLAVHVALIALFWPLFVFVGLLHIFMQGGRE